MKRFTIISLLFFMFVLLNTAVYPQCQVQTTNVIFESANSLTFDVYIKNTGITNWTYSHGSFVWNYNTSFLNGGTPTFSLVSGYSDFPLTAQPPSALLGSPSIMRTSSNLPGANGVILAGQNLRLYRFRLQTSAASFSGTSLNAAWKTIGTPYSRIFSWNSGTGLPEENLNPSFNMGPAALVLEENFDYGSTPDTAITHVTANWVRHSGATGPAYLATSLSYPVYPSSGIGGSVAYTFGSSGVNDGDVNRTLSSLVTTDNNVYVACLVNLSAARATADYFFHVGPSPISTVFRGRVFVRTNGAGWSLGFSKSTEAAVNDNTVLNFNQTYLVVIKYTFSTASASDDVATIYLYDTGYPAAEPGSPLVTIGPVGSGTGSDPVNIGTVAIRQGGNTPTGTIDGIRVGLTWAEVFPSIGSPVLAASPSTLSGFGYLPGGGPSTSQSYNLSGSDLTPLSGNITVLGTSSYEVSSDNLTFVSSFTIPYVGGVLASTPIYVRLKAGLPAGAYNGEFVTNTGGGADTAKVTCNGSVFKPEPTNHVTGFSGVLGSPSYARINLIWNDATGGTIPDGYLIKGSTYAFDSITVPIDGIPVANSFLVQNVAAGVQANLFSALNGGRTYYFKIFPYTNSGATINYKTDGTIPVFSLATTPPPALTIVETFNYTTGSYLTDNGWLAHSGAGSNPITVAATPLTYTGYFASGVGKSVTMVTSGEDANRAFDSVKTGSVYGSFLVNVTSAQASGDYIFHFGLENNTSLFFGKVFVKDSLGAIAFGLAKNQNTAVVYTPAVYSTATTYLIVVKYAFNTGTTTDDEAKLWINPVISGIEPASDLTQTDLGTDAAALGMFALRQGGSTSAAAITSKWYSCCNFLGSFNCRCYPKPYRIY